MSETPFVAMPDPQREAEKVPANGSASISNPQVNFERINKSICAVNASTYHWDIESDTIAWNGNNSKVFGQLTPENIETGRAYASLLDPDNFTSRFETVMRNKHQDLGEGVPFSIEYAIKPLGREQDHSIWIEDTGRWFAGPNGRPTAVYGMVRQIDDRHERDQHLQFMGNCDPLTGMMNRGRLTEALGEAIELSRTDDHTSAFLIVAVSNLNVVNDAYGFDVADEVIAVIGKRLREVVRTGDVIGRYSGSKFGIILSRATNEELEVAAERFLTIARQRVIETEMGPVWAMLSIGGISLPEGSADAQMTMSHTEEALSEAMRLPTDGFVAYHPSPDLASERHLNSRCAVEIVRSLKENRFTLAYQPVVCAKTHEVKFYEALLRMRCENGDVVSAGHLVPISEKLGLVRLIDRNVVHNVLAMLRSHPTAVIALNISGVTANDPRWFAKLTETLAENVDITNRLTIEITETVVLNDIEQTIGFIDQLHALGCKIAIDDFGAGFTSFRNLKVLNVDKVKIDGSFCVNLSNNQDNQFFVRTLIDLARKFNLQTVAEWVETPEDAELLTSYGVDFLQGHLFGKAQNQSPWGEAIDDDQDFCVVPSEILGGDTPEYEHHHDQHPDGDEQETQPSFCPFNPEKAKTAADDQSAPENTVRDGIQIKADAIQPFEVMPQQSETSFQIPDLNLPGKPEVLAEQPTVIAQETPVVETVVAEQQAVPEQPLSQMPLQVETPVVPVAPVFEPVAVSDETSELVTETTSEAEETIESQSEPDPISALDAEMSKLREAIRQLDSISDKPSSSDQTTRQAG